MDLITGTEYFENTYKDRAMKELINGGLVVKVEPGRPLTMFCVFPNPPFENGLTLHFPDKPPLDVVPAGDVLGEIRPAIPRGVAKIPRAPIVGTPVKVVLIDGAITVDAANNKLESMNPGGGNRFLGLMFKIEGEREFVARDYVLTDELETNYYPVAAACGRAAGRRVPGDGYEGVKLVPGETDLARYQRGKLAYWQYARGELLVLFAPPKDLKSFIFTHGNRVLKITPLSPPVSWKQARSGGDE